MVFRFSNRLLASVFLLFISSVGLTPARSEDRPNIILFLVDDMGIMDTSVPFMVGDDNQPKRYPLNGFYRTPNMERLASLGIRFNQFQAMSVCSPTRISMMTGQNAARHRTTNWIAPKQNNRTPHGPPDWNWKGLDKSNVTLPRLLQEAGYETIHVGKGHFGPEGTEGSNPRNIGFDVSFAGSAIGHPGSYLGEKSYGAGGSHAVPDLSKYHGTETFLTDALTRVAISSVDETVKKGKPFFLQLAHYAVHAPFESDQRFVGNYQASGKIKEAQAFASLIEGMDKSLGEIMDHLNKTGVNQKTLIIFLGDNGSDAPLGHEHEVACAAPLRGKKGTHYEGGMRVPFMAAWLSPNAENPLQKKWPIRKNSIQTQLANVTDLFPTILELAGVKSPEQHLVDGQSLVRMLQGERDESHSDEFLMHFPHGNHRSEYFTSFRKGDWKVVYHYKPQDHQTNGKSKIARYQLFDLKNDPFESNDLADGEPETLQKMMDELEGALTRHNALFPVSEKKEALRLERPVDSREGSGRSLESPGDGK